MPKNVEVQTYESLSHNMHFLFTYSRSLIYVDFKNCTKINLAFNSTFPQKKHLVVLMSLVSLHHHPCSCLPARNTVRLGGAEACGLDYQVSPPSSWQTQALAGGCVTASREEAGRSQITPLPQLRAMGNYLTSLRSLPACKARTFAAHAKC